MFHFNLAGWYDPSSQYPGRTTTAALPEGDWTTKVVGQLYPMFIGYGWNLIEYNGFDGDEVEPEEPPVPSVIPEIVVTNLEVDEAHSAQSQISDDLYTVTLPLGATLTVTAEIRAGENIIPLTESFRMPLVSLDGRMRLLLVNFINGVAVFSAQMTDSRIYHVKEEHVNQDLPDELFMKFKGFKVYSVE